jgi:hypothetical protein
MNVLPSSPYRRRPIACPCTSLGVGVHRRSQPLLLISTSQHRLNVHDHVHAASGGGRGTERQAPQARICGAVTPAKDAAAGDAVRVHASPVRMTRHITVRRTPADQIPCLADPVEAARAARMLARGTWSHKLKRCPALCSCAAGTAAERRWPASRPPPRVCSRRTMLGRCILHTRLHPRVVPPHTAACTHRASPGLDRPRARLSLYTTADATWESRRLVHQSHHDHRLTHQPG